MNVLQLVSCRGWSSDAYWAARATRELERRGHAVTLGCRRGTERAVIDRVREEGVERVALFEFAGGLRPGADIADVRRLRAAIAAADVVHVHRGKEHWLAVVAARLAGGRPVVRTRHIAQAVRPHAANRWLYGRATALVVAVTEAIRGQCLAAGLLPAERIVTLAGGADAEAYRPRASDPAVRRALGAEDGRPLVGMVSGLRVMKGHRVVIEAAARLAARGVRPRIVFIGRGAHETPLRQAIARAGLEGQVTIGGFASDLPAVMAALDVGLYVPLESDGMSRVVFEYLAAGRPLIAARVGVVAEVLADGEHAVLVPAGDPDALAASLAALLDDPARRARLGEAGRRLLVERYSGARLAAALETHYARLAAA
ncbi:MAG TPA: glycosyltransferase family 4 protein [Candidatus Binatia bacterium]|nr:glycosyltransferase family 4 protein [Candidatus Binatia bacterium]